MIIKIKGKQYQNPNWNVDKGIAVLKINSDASFAEITEDLALEPGDSIVQLNDSEEEIGIWYIEGMASIQMPGEDGSTVVTVKYHVSQISVDAQEALNDDLDMATLSVLELAGMLSTAKKNFSNTAQRLDQNFAEHDRRIMTTEQNLTQVSQIVNRWETMYNNLADRVARLENKEG